MLVLSETVLVLVIEGVSIAISPMGPQVPANRLDQRSASLQFEQPSSTSTVSLSTASLSTSTTESDAMRERSI